MASPSKTPGNHRGDWGREAIQQAVMAGPVGEALGRQSEQVWVLMEAKGERLPELSEELAGSGIALALPGSG